ADLFRCALVHDLVHQLLHPRFVDHDSASPVTSPGRRSASFSVRSRKPRYKRRFTVATETPISWAVSGSVLPWTRTRPKASRSSSGRFSIASSIRRPFGLNPEALLAGAGTSPSRNSTAAG